MDAASALFVLQFFAVMTGATLLYMGVFYSLISTTLSSRVESLTLMVVGMIIAVFGAAAMLR